MALLEEIAAEKQREVQGLDLAVLQNRLREARRAGQGFALQETGKRLTLCERLSQGFGVIAEIKRQSPSAGVLNQSADPPAVARGYELAGAVGISVLTDKKYFGGSLEDLRDVRAAVALPLLRKDFMIDRRQLYEAALAGADVILLIVRMLPPPQLKALFEEAGELGLESLIETHDQKELDTAFAALGHIPLLGVNNRNLDTLDIDLERCLELYDHLPPHGHAIAESGLKTPQDVVRARQRGYGGVLVGQALMQQADPAAALREMLEG